MLTLCREFQERAELTEGTLQTTKDELEFKIQEWNEREAEMRTELLKLRSTIDPMKLIGIQVRGLARSFF